MESILLMISTITLALLGIHGFDYLRERSLSRADISALRPHHDEPMVRSGGSLPEEAVVYDKAA